MCWAVCEGDNAGFCCIVFLFVVCSVFFNVSSVCSLFYQCFYIACKARHGKFMNLSIFSFIFFIYLSIQEDEISGIN